MSAARLLMIAIAPVLLAACAPQGDSAASSPERPGGAGTTLTRKLNIVTGQTVFVPAYSELRRGRDTVGLHTSLAIHNSDQAETIIIESVLYFDTDGTLVREYIEEPIELGPVGTLIFTARATERGAGVGANFIVRWGAETAVREPVVEAVMVGTSGAYSLLSTGRVVSETKP